MNSLGLPVSIILPTHNRCKRVDASISSVVAQTFQNWELLVCDDASDDLTSDIVEMYIKKDNRIRYIRNNRNLGLPATRNVGVASALYEYVLFIEDDLTLEPDCLNKLVVSAMEIRSNNNIGAIAPSVIDEWESSFEQEKTVLDFAWRHANRGLEAPCIVSSLTGLIRYNFSPDFAEVQEVPSVHACSLYSKQAILEVGGYDDRTFAGNFLYEEADINIRLRKAGFKLFFVPSAITHHRLAETGGCRVHPVKYGYYFLLNHIKFVVKNFGIKSLYMIPSFLFTFVITAIEATFRYYFSSQLG